MAGFSAAQASVVADEPGVAGQASEIAVDDEDVSAGHWRSG